jgi:hypothetical protein
MTERRDDSKKASGVSVGPNPTATAAANDTDVNRPFVFDVAKIPGQTNVELMGDAPEAQQLLDLLGRELVTRTLVQTPELTVYHETAAPGESVKPHRHGTYQVNFVLRGELFFGARRVGPGMGYFSPDKLYAWRAGDEGAEWIEIHSGAVGIYSEAAD